MTMNKRNLLLLITLFLSACSSSGQNDVVATDPSTPETTITAPGIVSEVNPPDASNRSGDQRNNEDVKLIIEPESLQIREICETPHNCVFRQKCGRLQLRLVNHTNHDIKAVRLITELVTKDGMVERSRDTIIPNGGYIVPAGGEVSSTKPSCSCRVEDRYCTPDYPHSASPFLWKKKERVKIYFESTDDSEKIAEASGIYEFIPENKRGGNVR